MLPIFTRQLNLIIKDTHVCGWIFMRTNSETMVVCTANTLLDTKG